MLKQCSKHLLFLLLRQYIFTFTQVKSRIVLLLIAAVFMLLCILLLKYIMYVPLQIYSQQ